MGSHHYLQLVCVVFKFISILHLSYTHNAPEDYVNAHNVVRKEVGMPPMTWDTTVAQFAEHYANLRKHDCALIHSHNGKYGENIAVGWGEFSGLDAVKLWVDEKADYNYESNSCTHGKMCGHYTQVVWKKSTHIGCARIKCLNNAYFVTCNYDPPGNYIGKKILKDLLQQSDNRNCADCGAHDPKWASPTIGVFICLKCCSAHRTLGPNVSKVLSVTIDEWADEEIDAMVEVGGNSSANSIYEAHVPKGVKPGPDASLEQRTKYIRSKYEFQEFLQPNLKISSNNAKSTLQASASKKMSFRAPSSSSVPKPELLEGAIGHLKITVLQGANLAVRDMLSSDPYVVVSLGEQRAQTATQSSNLNPIWNEELMLSVPEDYGPVKVQVFDYDTFSADDIMGEAEIDIQPMMTSVMAYGDASQFGDMQIGKWLKSHDNALLEDSTVNIVDGKIKQEVSLQLQNVESGMIYLEVEWIPP